MNRPHYSEAHECVPCKQKVTYNWTGKWVRFRGEWFSVVGFDTFNSQLHLTDENGEIFMIRPAQADAVSDEKP